MRQINIRRLVMWTLAAVVLTSNIGCRQILQGRARAKQEREKAAGDQALNGLKTEFDAAFEAGRWQDAAASFTPEREVTLKRYG